MFKNYFLLAWRHLGKNRGYTFINVAGLSIGMAIALVVIALWINDETDLRSLCAQSQPPRRGLAELSYE